MITHRKKPKILSIQLAVSLDVSTLALLVLAFFGATGTLGQLSQRPSAVLGKVGQCCAVVGACLLGDGTLSSLHGWKAGEQILELHFVPGTVTSWLIDTRDVRKACA